MPYCYQKGSLYSKKGKNITIFKKNFKAHPVYITIHIDLRSNSMNDLFPLVFLASFVRHTCSSVRCIFVTFLFCSTGSPSAAWACSTPSAYPSSSLWPCSTSCSRVGTRRPSTILHQPAPALCHRRFAPQG